MSDRAWYAERGFIASGVFLAVLVVFGGALVLTSGDGDREPAAGAKPVAGKAQRSDSVCGMPAGSQDPPVTPPEARWSLLGTIAVPAAREHGPGIDDGRHRRCFAHSPTGALFAAVNWWAQTGVHGRDADVMRLITAKNRTRDLYLRQRGADEDTDETTRVQVAGFQVHRATRDLVVVEIAWQSNVNGVILAVSQPMRWEDGDWRTVLGTPREPFKSARVTAMAPYVRWSGA